MAAIQSPDTDTSSPPRHGFVPNSCNYKPHSRDRWTSLLSSSSHLETALRTKTTQKRPVPSIQKRLHKQLLESHATSPISRAILISQSAPHTGAHLLQQNSEAHEAEDRHFRVSVARRLRLPHPAASDPSAVVLACSNKGAAGQICGKPVDAQQYHCNSCRHGGGVDRQHAAVAGCLADVIHSHNGTKVYIEQSIAALTRAVNGQVEHARMDLVFGQNGTTTNLDVAIVCPFSSSPVLIAAASTGPSQSQWHESREGQI